MGTTRRQALLAGAGAGLGLVIGRPRPALARGSSAVPEWLPPPPVRRDFSLPRLPNGVIDMPPGVRHPADGLDVVAGRALAPGLVSLEDPTGAAGLTTRTGERRSTGAITLVPVGDPLPEFSAGDTVSASGTVAGDTFEVAIISVQFASSLAEASP